MKKFLKILAKVLIVLVILAVVARIFLVMTGSS